MIIDISTAFPYLKLFEFASQIGTWETHSLMEQNKLKRASMVISLLLFNKGVLFLERIVTDDEKCSVYDKVRRKRAWKQFCEYAECAAKVCLRTVNVLQSIWWNCRLIIYLELLPVGKTVTEKKYCHQRNNLENRKGVIFLSRQRTAEWIKSRNG